MLCFRMFGIGAARMTLVISLVNLLLALIARPDRVVCRSSLRETTRGVGAVIWGCGSGQVRSSGTLRPKRCPARPTAGSERSL